MLKLSMDDLNRISVEEFKNSEKTPAVIVLDNVRSQNNIGSVFRTADAFRMQAVYLCGITAVPPNKEIHKTALGSTESVDWLYFENTMEAIKQLKQSGYAVFSVEQAVNSIMLDNFTWPDNISRLALVFGNEVNGVEEAVIECSDGIIEIPQIGTKHSLNLAVSAGIVLWEMFTGYKKRPAIK